VLTATQPIRDTRIFPFYAATARIPSNSRGENLERVSRQMAAR
jgi:hypothetical protein